MAALYLLNIYYKKQEFNVVNFKESMGFDKSLGSLIFSIITDIMYKENVQINKCINDSSSCTYIAIFNDAQVENITSKIISYNKQALEIVKNDIGLDLNELFAKHISNTNMIWHLGEVAGKFILKKKIEGIINRDEQIKILENSDEYKEYVKISPGNVIDFTDDICKVITRISYGYYYKNLMDLASVAGSFTFSSSSKLVLNKIPQKVEGD